MTPRFDLAMCCNTLDQSQAERHWKMQNAKTQNAMLSHSPPQPPNRHDFRVNVDFADCVLRPLPRPASRFPSPSQPLSLAAPLPRSPSSSTSILFSARTARSMPGFAQCTRCYRGQCQDLWRLCPAFAFCVSAGRRELAQSTQC
jgi:hypothetical protein